MSRNWISTFRSKAWRWTGWGAWWRYEWVGSSARWRNVCKAYQGKWQGSARHNTCATHLRTGPAQKLTVLADQVISAQVTSLTSDINFLSKEELHPKSSSVQRLLGMDERADEHFSDEHFKEEHFKTEHYNAEQFKADLQKCLMFWWKFWFIRSFYFCVQTLQESKKCPQLLLQI